MGNQVFQQNLDDKKGPQPGGPYLIQMLFKEPVEMPDKEKMTAIMEKHIGSTECFCYDKKMAGFAAQDHIAEFKDGKCPVQLMVMKCDKFKGKGFDAFLMSQMWDCQEDRDRIFRECRYQVVATDMLTAALPALERANLDADFLEALAELYPTCEAFYFQNCGKLFLADDVRSNQIEGPDRFIRFGVNVRFFNIEGTEDMLIDTVGMSTLFLPDLQYHFHGMDPNWVVNHAYNVASYILEHDNPIQDGETIDGVAVEYANEVYAQLGQEVKARAQAGKLGYDILLNERERLFGFYLYKGNDLTATNTEGNTPCIFSRDFDNVNEQEYTASIENCGNFIYVQGAADDDSSQPVTTVDGEGATGLDLVEVFCDATDIARKYQQGETEVTIPLNTYIAMLKTRGGAELENYGKNINFVSTINTNSNLKFKADFDLGDRITCKETKWGIQIDARITEVTETYQKGEETIEATFGDSLPTLVDQIRKVR